MSIVAPFLAFLLVGAFAAYHRLRLAYWAAITATLLVACWLLGANHTAVIIAAVCVALIAVPLLIQTYGIFALGYAGAHWLKLPHNIAAPACLIGTSNFFELAVAVAISLFGLNSGAALATVVGVLVEVPVMLSLVAIINRTQHWFPRPASQRGT